MSCWIVNTRVTLHWALASIFFGFLTTLITLCASGDAQAEEASPLQRVAILELKNLAPGKITSAEVKYLSDEVRRITSLFPKERYLIMTKENIELMLPPDVKLEDCQGSCEVETGRLLQADFLITGELIKFGSSLRVSLKAHDTRSGTYLKGSTAKGKDVEELEEPIHLATLGLMLEISSVFKAELTNKAGVKLQDQLACLKDESKCAPSRPHSSAAAPTGSGSPAPALPVTGSNPLASHTPLAPSATMAQSPPASQGLTTLGLTIFGVAYGVTVLGTALTDPWPGQVNASLIPFYGPIKVESINQDHGDDSFMVANYALFAIQVTGAALVLSELFNAPRESATTPKLSFAPIPGGQSLSVLGRF